MITDAKVRAVESLIHDRDPATRRLLIQELECPGEESLRLLRHLSQSTCREVRAFARELLAKQEGFTRSRIKHATDLKTDAGPSAPAPSALDCTVSVVNPIKRLENWSHLEEFCWSLCAAEFAGFNTSEGRRVLDAWANEVDDVSCGCDGPTDRIRKLRAVLSRRFGLAGNFRDYYHPHNSYLNRVIETRRGIPLTLSLLYIFVGRRIGWQVTGLNLPGHYIARVDNVAFDPFFGARVLKTEELARRYYLPESEFRDLSAFDASASDTARRMLCNLYRSYLQLGDCARLERVAGQLQYLSESF